MMADRPEDLPKFVALFFPDGYQGQKFCEFMTKDLYYEGKMEQLRMIKIYVDEIGWKHCYVVTLADTSEELKRDFKREKKEFLNNFESIKTKFVILYFSDSKRGKMFDTFDIKDINYRGPLAEGVWIEILDVKFGWRYAFVVAIYDSLNEMIISFDRVTEKFAKDLRKGEAKLRMKDKKDPHSSSTTSAANSYDSSRSSTESSENASTSSAGSSWQTIRSTDTVWRTLPKTRVNLFGAFIDEEHRYNKPPEANAEAAGVDQLVPFTDSTEAEIIKAFIRKTRQ